MRRGRVHAGAAALLLACPVALAFFSGGYFAEPRIVAALVAWVLVLVLAVVGPSPLPATDAGRLALGGLGGLAAWTAASIDWAPLGGPAVAAVQRLLLYVAVLIVGVGVLRAPAVRRAVEPALAAGATLVIGYGLAGRLLPGLIHLDRSLSAGGRLEQPITYWNTEGLIAGLGVVLCARLAGDPGRGSRTQALAAAAIAPLAAGVYLSYSRGAIAVTVVGLVVLVAVAATRWQLRAAVVALVSGLAAIAATAPFPGVASLEGRHPERDGAIALVLLVLIAAVAAAITARGTPSPDPLSWARHAGRAGVVLAVVIGIGLLIGGLGERPSDRDLARGAQAGRLTTVSSNRYEYWRIGLKAFADAPVAGIGAGGFRVRYLRERSSSEVVRDVHSIVLEQLVELGLVGLLAFLAVIAGAVAAARQAIRRHRAAAAGPCAVGLMWLMHAAIDWDWQFPAAAVPAITVMALLIVLSEPGTDPAA